MSNKTPITIAIETAYCGQHCGLLADPHVQTYIKHRYSLPFKAIYGRSCGKTYFLPHNYLIQQAQSLSAGATLKVYKGRTPHPRMQRITGYDPGNGNDQSVESVFEHNPTTGVFTLISTRIVRRRGVQPTISIDEWPWFDEQ